MGPRPGWDPGVDILKLKRPLNLRNHMFKKLRNWSEGLGSHQKAKKFETLAQKWKFLIAGVVIIITYRVSQNSRILENMKII